MTVKAPKRLLFGPGPSPVAPRVYEAMQQNVVGHLDPFFLQTAREVRKLLGYAFSTTNEFNLALSGTGSSGMEAAVANFTEPGTKFALLSNGFFGDRIGEIARRQGGESQHPPNALRQEDCRWFRNAAPSSLLDWSWSPSFRYNCQ